MQKTKLFVTASAVCFALAGAALSERQSEAAALIRPVAYYNDACLTGIETYPSSCSLTGLGAQCLVHVRDSWGNDAWPIGYASPTVANLCILPLFANI